MYLGGGSIFGSPYFGKLAYRDLDEKSPLSLVVALCGSGPNPS